MSKITTGKLWSKASIAAVAMTTAGASLTGIASACSGNQGSGYGGDNNHTTSYGGYGGSSDFRLSDWHNANLNWADDWDNYSPQHYRDEGRSFDNWYNDCMSYLSGHSSMQWGGYGGGQDSYGGDDWDSWNPQNYQGQGNYGDWYQHMMQYMHDNYGQWQQNWGENNDHDNSGGYGGGQDNNNDNNQWGGQGGNGGDQWGGYGGNGGSNQQTYTNTQDTTITNTNDVNVSNTNPQTAVSGDANVNGNDDVNNVSTGDAYNQSQADFSVSIDNSSSTDAASANNSGGNGGDWSGGGNDWSDSGRNSNNRLTVTNTVNTTVKNTNDVSLTNNNPQTAISGDANVHGNDDVRYVTTGDAVNTSNASFDVSINN